MINRVRHKHVTLSIAAGRSAAHLDSVLGASPYAQAAHLRGEPRGELLATDSCTMNRLAAVQASPMLRILASMAPSTGHRGRHPRRLGTGRCRRVP